MTAFSKIVEPYPLLFERKVRTTLWGSEAWLVSVHPVAPCIVRNGAFAGRRLDEIVPDYDLLVKSIDARLDLSVQVHPNEMTAPLTGGHAKTEMWFVLEAREGASIIAGLKHGVGEDEIRAAIESGDFEKVSVRHEVKAGCSYFIPGGLVHSIGGGVKVFEVQQGSDTTYRLYDWGRVGADGKPRQLHVEKALLSVDYSLEPPVEKPPYDPVECKWFSFSRHRLEPSLVLKPESSRPIVVYPIGGAVDVVGTWGSVRVCGEAAMIPRLSAATVVAVAAGVELMVVR